MKLRGDAQRLEAMERALDRLRQDADGALIVVEGQKDALALDTLGIGGIVRLVHTGRALEPLIDDLAREAGGAGLRVILLVDWDRTGGRLFRRLHDGLAARAPVDGEHRRRLAQVTHTRNLEEVPADLAGLRRRVGAIRSGVR